MKKKCMLYGVNYTTILYAEVKDVTSDRIYLYGKGRKGIEFRKEWVFSNPKDATEKFNELRSEL